MRQGSNGGDLAIRYPTTVAVVAGSRSSVHVGTNTKTDTGLGTLHRGLRERNTINPGQKSLGFLYDCSPPAAKRTGRFK